MWKVEDKTQLMKTLHKRWFTYRRSQNRKTKSDNEMTLMCKVEEYNAVMRTTTQSKVYKRKMTISEEKMKEHYVEKKITHT